MSDPTAHVTLADVAMLAGVSLATASRALGTGHGRTVTPELRARVHAAALELNYSPNAHAQAMRGTSSAIGLIVHDIADPFASSVASGVMAAAAERGLIVTIASSGGDPDHEVRLMETLRRQRVTSVILAGSRFSADDSNRWLAEEAAGIRAAGGRVALIGRRQFPASVIEIDNYGGAADLARSLWAQGYRSYLVLAGPDSLVTSEDRVAGFRDALAELGYQLPDENVISSMFSRDGGYAAMSAALDEGMEAECLFAVNDVMAIGAIAALRDRGQSVPEDMAVAGFDDIPMLRDVLPALTTVRLPLVEIGRRAFELASTDAGPEGTCVAVRGDVVLRASTPAR
ncbi:LacI family transcriptional regulator [Nakamurella silvestris]|nr:LacI family transcriptional regulator [Nakamurella silvestris]